MPPWIDPDRRATPRVDVALDLSLMRRSGHPVSCRTLDLGAGGARVATARPLKIDEELSFELDLPRDDGHVDGRARVLRQHEHNVYALRFERLEPAVVAALRAFVGTADP